MQLISNHFCHPNKNGLWDLSNLFLIATEVVKEELHASLQVSNWLSGNLQEFLPLCSILLFLPAKT